MLNDIYFILAPCLQSIVWLTKQKYSLFPSLPKADKFLEVCHGPNAVVNVMKTCLCQRKENEDVILCCMKKKL